MLAKIIDFFNDKKPEAKGVIVADKNGKFEEKPVEDKKSCESRITKHGCYFRGG